MLQLLKESVSSKHAERLEQIVIVLIGIEIGASHCWMFVFQLFWSIYSSRHRHYPCRFNGLINIIDAPWIIPHFIENVIDAALPRRIFAMGCLGGPKYIEF